MKIKSKIQIDRSNSHALAISENSYQTILKAVLIDNSAKRRTKRSDDDKTLVDATVRGDYSYSLNAEDIVDIVRIEHQHYQIIKNQFEIINSATQLKKILRKILIKGQAQTEKKDFETRFTLIFSQINSEDWSTVVIYGEENNYFGFYAHPKGEAFSDEYQDLFNKEKIELVTLTKNFVQQEGVYNSGLWAIENAADLNRMILYKKDLFWGRNQLKQVRNKDYFDLKRKELAKKLYFDSYWRQHHADSLASINPEKIAFPFEITQDIDSSLDNSEPATKRLKVSATKDVKELSTVFIESFITRFFQQIAAFHIIALGNDLTMEALKSELKSELINGGAGAVFGLGISQGIAGNSMGVIPSMVASGRAIIAKLLAKKEKGVAKKITKFFETVNKETLTGILCEAAIHIFYSYEYQFLRITDKAGDRVAMEKLADDAVDRVINYLNNHRLDDSLIMSNELIEKAILQGPSETFFDPRLRILQIKIQGKRLLTDKFENIESEIPINTAKLYEKVGLITFDSQHQLHKLYVSQTHRAKYGYRRLLSWEKNENGDLNDNLQADYTEKDAVHEEYQYVLAESNSQTYVQSILDKINTYLPSESRSVLNQRKINKPPIYFDLRDPVADFTGRVEIREELHRILTKDNNMAVISALSAVSISSPSTSRLASQEHSISSQVSISGLGGIGKTQLALQYAKEHAPDYDNNVLWINAETLENLSYSFTKLANKLEIETKDHYGEVRQLEAIVEDIYEYFSDRKSLFILDNVENYREIEIYLPKSMQGHKPTILITSRYTNWQNVAKILSLGFFTDQEAIALFENAKTLADPKDIKQLNHLLQGLPLALKQAIAYINLQKRFKSIFSINDYIELYKEKNQKLLNFDFSNYINDSYLKTVFTTWLITLDKIRTQAKGEAAIDLLFMMAYLDPENISNKIFYPLDILDTDETDNLIYLLESYSMINPGQEIGKYTIHRLVQQVLRINLEANPAKFTEIYKKLRSILRFKLITEQDYHYAHFLVYMSEFKENLNYDTIKNLFNEIACYKKTETWHYFFDLAYLKFPKKKYLDFLGDALGYSVKSGYFDLVYEIFNYLEIKFKIEKISKPNIKYILELAQNNKNPHYRLTKRSGDAEISRQQTVAVQVFVSLKARIFDDPFTDFDSCTSSALRRKRNSCSPQTLEEREQRQSRVVRSHIEKVALTTHFVNSGLMSKNILSAIMRKDWDEVAINFELIGSSKILEELSNRVFLTPGKNLEIEAHLLEEHLGLENEKVWSLLLNKKVSFVGKKLFFGKSLQVASSFVSRGTGIYFAYNLGKQIKAYQAGDTEQLPDIISNGVTTGAIVVEIGIEGLEYFEYIIGFAGKVNPYLEGISALVWLGTEIYEAEEQIQSIQKHVHLSWKEWYVEFWRGFFHYSPSNYLQAKAKNTQLVEYAVGFLKNHTDFRSYIFPIFSSELVLFENNTVLLDHRRTVALGIEVPDAPVEGDLFCLSGTPKTNETSNPLTYLCHQALGVEYSVNRSAKINLFNLGIGNDTVFAFIDLPNYFFVQNGEKDYTGGDEGNIFRLEGNATWGQLSGGKKSDALLLEQFAPENSVYVLIDSESYLCGSQQPFVNLAPLPCTFNRIKLSGLNQIYGRSQQQDVIYLNPDIYFFDGHGGSGELHPDVVFVTEHSYENPIVVLRNNTLVWFLFETSIKTIDYQIPRTEMGKAEIRTHFSSEIQHRFFFDCAFEDIVGMDIQNDTLTLSVCSENNSDLGLFTITLWDPSLFNLEYPHRNVTHFEKNNSYFFQNIEIKLISNDRLFAQEVTNSDQTIEEYIDRFSEIAKYLNRTMTVQLQNNVLLMLGQSNHEIFYVDGLFPSHLVGNGGENVYRITSNNNKQFLLAEIVIYRLNTSPLNQQIDTLDLHQLVNDLKKTCPLAIIAYHLSLQGQDLILTLTGFIPADRKCSDVDSTWELVSVRIKNGLDWYQNLDVLLEDTIPKQIVTHDGEEWILSDRPLLFGGNKKIISLTDQDLGENSEIALLRNSGNYSFFRDVSDLMMTNIHTDPLGACTLVVHDYYHNPAMKQKFLSVKLDFLDEGFYLKDHQALIDEAQSFSDLIEQLTKPASERKHFPLIIPIRSQELPKMRLKRQIPLSMKFKLASPESKGWVSLGIGTSLTVMLTLTGCFYWRSKRRQQTVPLLVAALSSLPAVSAHEQKIFAEKTPVDFSSGFSIENDCLTAMTPMGWLAVCENKRSLVFLKNHQKSGSFYFESYQMNNSFLQRVGDGIWEANLCETTHNALAEEIYPLLPKHWQKELLDQWSQQRAWSNWKYHAGMTVTSMVGDGLVLHTPVGNIFKQLGLAPDWQSREDRYFLSRCGLALAQPLFHLSLMPSSLSLGLISMELALLHPATHRAYRYLSQQGDVTKAKFALRLVADMLQLGVNQLSHLANMLDYCFPTSDLVKHMSLALRISHYFYFLTGDLSYWHLGLSLFFLPQLPRLLDQLGIPASRAVQKVCQQLANVLLGQSRLQSLAKDAERQVQSDHELSRADACVTQAQQCFKRVAMASSRFFMTRSADSCSVNDEHQEKPMTLQFFK